MHMNINNIITEIEAGHYDAHLNDLLQCITQRMHIKRRDAQMPRTGANFNVGTLVRFNNATSTSYIRGMQGTIVEKKRSLVTVLLNAGPVGRFQTGRIVCSVSILEVV